MTPRVSLRGVSNFYHSLMAGWQIGSKSNSRYSFVHIVEIEILGQPSQHKGNRKPLYRQGTARRCMVTAKVTGDYSPLYILSSRRGGIGWKCKCFTNLQELERDIGFANYIRSIGQNSCKGATLHGKKNVQMPVGVALLGPAAL